MKMAIKSVVLSAVCGLALAASPALAVDNPFTEDFSSSSNNWSTASVFTPVGLVMTGGPDGSQYATRSFSFGASGAGDQPILFRGQSNFNSSGGAFVGNWLTGGVTEFSFSIRHNAPEALDIFARFSNPSPGAGVVSLATGIAPNTWTLITVDITNQAGFIYEGLPTLYNTVFGNVGRVQLGAIVPADLAGTTASYTFDIDNVSIVPVPGAAGLLGLAGLVATRRRR